MIVSESKNFLFPLIKAYLSSLFAYEYTKDDLVIFFAKSERILIESNLGIKNLLSLLNNPHIDFIYFGAYDLSVELGKPGQIFDNEIIKNLEYLIKKVKITNKKIMSIYRNKDELEILLKMGVNYPVASVDTSHIQQKLTYESQEFFQIKNNLSTS